MSASRYSEQEIAAIAYSIYLNNGCPPGRDVEHWLQAETQLMSLYRDNSSWELFDSLQPEFWSNGVTC